MKTQIGTVQKYRQKSTDRSGVNDFDSTKRKRSIKMARLATNCIEELAVLKSHRLTSPIITTRGSNFPIFWCPDFSGRDRGFPAGTGRETGQDLCTFFINHLVAISTISLTLFLHHV